MYFGKNFCWIEPLCNGQPTYFEENRDYAEILDLFISSPEVAAMVDRFWVDSENGMTSDHVPVILSINAAVTEACSRRESKYNYHRANWEVFKAELEARRVDFCNDDLDDLNNEIGQKILTSAERAIPKVGEKI